MKAEGLEAMGQGGGAGVFSEDKGDGWSADVGGLKGLVGVDIAEEGVGVDAGLVLENSFADDGFAGV